MVGAIKAPVPNPDQYINVDDVSNDIKRRAVRGGAFTALSQAGMFIIRFGSTAIMARILVPADYGLIAMTAVVTGFVGMFKDAGLTMATIQKPNVTHRQVSTLFWINVALGCLIAAALIASAPAVAAFYKEPRLVGITQALALGFVFGGLTLQHLALLRRRLRFGVVALLDVVSSAGGALLGIAMARAGYGYWSLVGMSVGASMFNAIGVWIANPWRPTWPSRGAGVRPLLSFGSHLLVFDIVYFFSRQVDMLLIGSFWGATQLGLYEKAYNLLLQPIAQVTGPVGAIVQPALARAQTDLVRYRRFFLGAFELVVSVSLPVVVGVGLFAREIVLFLLGPKWLESVPIFYYLAPAVAALVLLNPWGWLTISLGNTSKHRWVGTINAAVIVLSFFIGISGGPKGVAMAYSVTLFLTMVPTWWYVTKGTPVHLLDVTRNAFPPLIAATIALSVTAFVKGSLQLGVLGYWGGTSVAAMCFAALYAIVLFGVFRKWAFFRHLIQELRGSSK